MILPSSAFCFAGNGRLFASPLCEPLGLAFVLSTTAARLFRWVVQAARLPLWYYLYISLRCAAFCGALSPLTLCSLSSFRVNSNQTLFFVGLHLHLTKRHRSRSKTRCTNSLFQTLKVRTTSAWCCEVLGLSSAMMRWSNRKRLPSYRLRNIGRFRPASSSSSSIQTTANTHVPHLQLFYNVP